MKLAFFFFISLTLIACSDLKFSEESVEENTLKEHQISDEVVKLSFGVGRSIKSKDSLFSGQENELRSNNFLTLPLEVPEKINMIFAGLSIESEVTASFLDSGSEYELTVEKYEIPQTNELEIVITGLPNIFIRSDISMGDLVIKFKKEEVVRAYHQYLRLVPKIDPEYRYLSDKKLFFSKRYERLHLAENIYELIGVIELNNPYSFNTKLDLKNLQNTLSFTYEYENRVIREKTCSHSTSTPLKKEYISPLHLVLPMNNKIIEHGTKVLRGASASIDLFPKKTNQFGIYILKNETFKRFFSGNSNFLGEAFNKQVAYACDIDCSGHYKVISPKFTYEYSGHKSGKVFLNNKSSISIRYSDDFVSSESFSLKILENKTLFDAQEKKTSLKNVASNNRGHSFYDEMCAGRPF